MLLLESGTSSCLLGHERVGVLHFAVCWRQLFVASLGQCLPSVCTCFIFLSVVFPKWKVLVGVCVAVRLVHVMLDCVTKYMVWLCGGGAVFPSVCHRDLFM